MNLCEWNTTNFCVFLWIIGVGLAEMVVKNLDYFEDNVLQMLYCLLWP